MKQVRSFWLSNRRSRGKGALCKFHRLMEGMMAWMTKWGLMLAIWGLAGPVQPAPPVVERQRVKLEMKIPPAKTPSKREPPFSPGVYRSEPYSMLVLVPPPHPDERGPWMSAPTNGARSGTLSIPMPILEPDLRLVPYPRHGVTNR
jgi:hypothetical protein